MKRARAPAPNDASEPDFDGYVRASGPRHRHGGPPGIRRRPGRTRPSTSDLGPGARTVRLRIKVTGQAYPLRLLKTGALLPGPQTGILSGTVYHFEGVPRTRTFDRPPGEQYTCVYSDPQLPIDVTLEDSFTYPGPGRYTVTYSFGVCAAAPGWPLDRRYLPAGSLIGGDLTVVVR